MNETKIIYFLAEHHVEIINFLDLMTYWCIIVLIGVISFIIILSLIYWIFKKKPCGCGIIACDKHSKELDEMEK